MATVTLPNTLTNGETADADEVQANDAALLAGVNNVEAEQIVDNTIVNSNLDVSVSPVTRFPETGGQNFVVDADSWITTTVSGDLNYTVPSFVPYVSGTRIVNSGFTRAYTASVDTYLDIDSTGSITFSEVSNGATAPSQTSGTLRLLKVVTDSSEVTDVETLATDIAFTPSFDFEYRYAEINIAKNEDDPDVLGNQQITVIFRGKDTTGLHDLDTGTSGVVIDTANKQLANGMDTNITPTANTVFSIWIIGASDGSEADAAILSQESAPFGIGQPIFPAGYDIARWHSLVYFDSSSHLAAGVTTAKETIFHEHMKAIFPASMNGTWTVIDFESLMTGISDHVGAVRIQSITTNAGVTGYANESVTGTTDPISQTGSIRLARAIASGSEDSSVVWVPINISGTANFFSNVQVDGTSAGGQSGATSATGLGLIGFKYKHE